MALYWNNLLKPERQRNTPTVTKTPNDSRSPFKKDFDTVCNSTILRRLQDKAQVFPLEDEDYARTRLTHSIEAMSIAESIGIQAVGVIKQKSKKYYAPSKRYYAETMTLVEEIPTLLKTAALLHDMGNPPFGHLGEQIIGDWFKNNLGNMIFKSDNKLYFKTNGDAGDSLTYKLKGQYQDDLTHFEGNAQLFRLVNKLCFVVDEYGMNLTFPVMSTFVKYPTSSSKINKDSLFTKKLGYFASEENIFKKIDKTLCLDGYRHPLSFLLEAADDISYLTADIEDAHHKGLITLSKIKSYLKKEENDELIKNVLAAIENYEKQANTIGYNEVDEYVVHRTRVLVKGLMIDSICTAFQNVYEQIMEKEFCEELLAKSTAAKLADVLRTIEKDNIYYSKHILKNKTMAFAVIEKLLEAYIPAVVNWNKEDDLNKDTTNNLLYQSLSKNYRFVCETANKKAKTDEEVIYNKILLVTDQISGMTDSHALTIYKTITASM